MKHTCIYILIIIFISFFASCDKKDYNGKLGGTWQLLEWRSSNNELVATKESQIFYSFQLSMFKAQRRDADDKFYFRHASFQHIPDSIIIYRPLSPSMQSGHEAFAEMSVLAPYGVDEDGRFFVVSLTDDVLVLRRTDESILTFRKY